ncbi:MAG: hypothetical protein EXX96DRAFT_575866 [Benjaminiella poitrasii]|nr:MAG: hypothetical protein EXX96DRAFT_575866 [Benjaminiella poitrasii]
MTDTTSSLLQNPNTSIEMGSPTKKRKRVNAQEAPVRIASAPAPPTTIALTPSTVALPPPLIPYAPHFYYPAAIYHQQHHPYILTIGPQPPISPSLTPTSPTPTPNSEPKSANAHQRILPKSSTADTALSPPAALSPTYNLYPYHPMQLSPQLHPNTTAVATTTSPPATPYHTIRHNSAPSISSVATTADQREQARKESHSAIERRRREKMNDKILQLKELIPSCANRENLHKMNILQSAIDYIVYLQNAIKEKQEESKGVDSKSLEEESTAQEDPNSQPNSKDSRPKEEDDDDCWSATSSSSSRANACVKGLKPMDVIQSDSLARSAPTIVVVKGSQESSPNILPASSSVNMNLENILC